MDGLVGGAAQRSADCRKTWTTALIPWSLELIPPVQSLPRRRGLLGVVEGTEQRGPR